MKCVLPFLILLAACDKKDTDTGEGDPCDAGSNPTIVIGHGETEFLPLDGSSTEVELVHGPQGGFHTNISLEATYLADTVAWETHLEGTIDGELVGETRPFADMRCNRSTNTLQGVGLLLIWDGQPEDLHGKTASVHATVTDSDGTVIEADAQYVIHDPSLE